MNKFSKMGLVLLGIYLLSKDLLVVSILLK